MKSHEPYYSRLTLLEMNAALHSQLNDLAEFATTQSDNLKFKDAAIIDLNNTNHALLARIADLEAENARLRAEAAWISVEDRLPEVNDTYLVYYGEDECYGAERPVFGTKSPVFTERVTHWRELPAPPVIP